MKLFSVSLFYYFLIMLAMLILSACAKKEIDALKQGDKFPLAVLLKLITDSNKPVDIRGKLLLINFWASWCTPCRKEMPDLQALSETLDKNKFLVIGISIDTDKNLMQEFLLQHKIHFSNYQDPDQQLASQQLAIQAYPETFIVSPTGIIIKRITGKQAWNSKTMHSLIRSFYQEKKSNTLTTGLHKN